MWESEKRTRGKNSVRESGGRSSIREKVISVEDLNSYTYPKLNYENTRSRKVSTRKTKK